MRFIGKVRQVRQPVHFVDEADNRTVRAHNLALAEQFYILEAAAYNKDTKIVRKDQLHFVERKAWQSPIDKVTLEAIANEPRSGSRVFFEDAVLVSAHNEDEAKRLARAINTKLAMRGNLFTLRLKSGPLKKVLRDKIPDFRVVPEADPK